MRRNWNVAVIVGSLREGSFNRKAALELIRLAPDNLKMKIVQIGDLPFYNEDVEAAGAPEEWEHYRQQIHDSDAVLFVTPEYNRSVPGVLKNAVDVGSRPFGAAALVGKPAAVMSVSTGAISGFGANHHLRQSLVALGMPALQHPEAYVGGAAALFDEEGRLINEETSKFFRKFIRAFARWIELVTKEEATGNTL